MIMNDPRHMEEFDQIYQQHQRHHHEGMWEKIGFIVRVN
jgi:hypothetical protein